MRVERPHRAGRVATTVVVVALAVVGCASPQPEQEGTTPMVTTTASGPEGPADSTPPTDAGPTAAPPVAPTPSAGPTDVEDLPVPAPTGAPITVTGTVAAGVESGCLVLTAGGTTYLLLGSSEELPPGREVTVEGTLAPDLLTSCQQGTPLQVRAVRAP